MSTDHSPSPSPDLGEAVEAAKRIIARAEGGRPIWEQQDEDAESVARALLSLSARVDARAEEWRPIETAPHNQPIECLAADGAQFEIEWEEHRACMLGARAGAHGPGWQDTFNRLPCDEPVFWRSLLSAGK